LSKKDIYVVDKKAKQYQIGDYFKCLFFIIYWYEKETWALLL